MRNRRTPRALCAALSLLLILALLLCGCNAEQKGGDTQPGSWPLQSDTVEGANTITDQVQSETTGQKLIRNASITAETQDYEAARAGLFALVADYGGYVSSSYESGTAGETARRLRMTLRIPAERLDDFLSGVGGVLHVTSSNITTEEITAQYADVAARLETLRAEKAALDKMLAEALEINELLAIHQRLYDVMEEIDRYEAQIRVWDDKVAESTVELTCREVGTFTTTAAESFGTRAKNAFLSSWRTFGNFCRGFVIFLIQALPVLLVVGVAVVLLILILRRRRRNRRRKGDDRFMPPPPPGPSTPGPG